MKKIENEPIKRKKAKRDKSLMINKVKQFEAQCLYNFEENSIPKSTAKFIVDSINIVESNLRTENSIENYFTIQKALIETQRHVFLNKTFLLVTKDCVWNQANVFYKNN